MIKRLFGILTIVLASALAATTAQASVLTWSIHNLTFEVPDGGTVTYNSADHFEIMWDDMAIIISLYNKQGVNDKNTDANGIIDYTESMTIFAAFGAAAILISFLLLIEDKKKGYGLQKANIKQ